VALFLLQTSTTGTNTVITSILMEPGLASFHLVFFLQSSCKEIWDRQVFNGLNALPVIQPTAQEQE